MPRISGEDLQQSAEIIGKRPPAYVPPLPLLPPLHPRHLSRSFRFVLSLGARTREPYALGS